MTIQRPSNHPQSPPPRPPLSALPLLCLLLLAGPLLRAQRTPVATRTLQALSTSAVVDAGQISVSEPLTLTLRLRPTSAQTAALDQLLSDQTDPASPSYHRWLSPQQLASLITYLQSHSLAVTAVSPAHTRISVSGTAGQAQLAFATDLHRFSIDHAPYFATATAPTLPAAVAALVSGISGLDNLPGPAAARILIGASNAPASSTLARLFTPAVTPTPQPDPISAIAEAIDANSSPILTLATEACVSDLSELDIAAFRDLFRQASAQGITVIATSSCQSPAASSFPANLAQVTALTTSPRETSATATEPRPSWQSAPGLPADNLRHEPDLTASSAAAFAQAISTLNLATGNRLGNLNPTLYALAKTPGLFTQPDPAANSSTAAPAGAWQPATGLGLIDLNTLLKVYPRGNAATTIDFQSTTYSVSYGTPFTLRANINATGNATSPPTGTVTFTASSQGVLGSAAVNNGSATLDSGLLPVGAYTIVATYSGDANYSPSSKGGVTISVNIVNARLQATLSPSVSVPYGATATATVTVTLPNSSASPSGDVYAQIQGVTGAFYTATLSPNPGGNSATANIVLSIPSPGGYTVEVSCQGNQNFQCQTPVLLPIKTVKGYTNASITVNPAAPQAGQPVYITASVANAGNGTGTYTYGGSISFYDSGKLIASAPVATNQATASVSLSGTRTHNLTAVYSGDTNWNTSTSGAVAVLPTLLPTGLTITTNTNGFSSLAGINIVFTAAVTTDTNYGKGPTGYVTFFDTFNGAVLQLGNGAVLVANGPNSSIATFTSTGLLPGLHHVYAQYTGDDIYAAVTSPVTVLSIADFSLTMNPPTLSIAQGKSAQVSILVGAGGGYTGSVSLGCTPPGSSEATCNISPTSVSVGQSATITFTTTAPRSAASGQQAHSVIPWTCATGVSLASLCFFLLAPRRRPLASLLLLLLAAGLTANLGCAIGTTSTTASAPGGGSGTTPSDPGTPLGTQNFAITASGSDGVNIVRHTYQYQVTVQ